MLRRSVGGHLGTVALLASVLAGTAPRASARVPIDVMTFNIRTSNGRAGNNAWPNRKALVAGTIEWFAPRLVGLQEALDEQVEYLASALPDYRWFGIDRGLNGGQGLSEYTPILYRHAELSPVESGTFWLSSTPDTPEDTPGWPGFSPEGFPDRHLGPVPSPGDPPADLRLQHPPHAPARSAASRLG